jgi:hypothetical protein
VCLIVRTAKVLCREERCDALDVVTAGIVMKQYILNTNLHKTSTYIRIIILYVVNFKPVQHRG